jgi:hypothetical protein
VNGDDYRVGKRSEEDEEEEEKEGWPLRNITTLSGGWERASEGGESLMGRL